MTGRALSTGSCPERARLVAELKSAHREIVLVHKEQLDAALNQNFDEFVSLEPRLSKARRRREQAAEALKYHLTEHGCSACKQNRAHSRNLCSAVLGIEKRRPTDCAAGLKRLLRVVPTTYARRYCCVCAIHDSSPAASTTS